jgi:hypothetical protein
MRKRPNPSALGLRGFCPSLALSSLGGCDPIYGIFSTEIITEIAPDDSCILATLRQTPGVLEASEQIVNIQGRMFQLMAHLMKVLLRVSFIKLVNHYAKRHS